MRNTVIEPYVVKLCSIILGLIFLFSSITKVLDITGFMNVVYSYQILPVQLIPFLSFLLVCVELVLGLFFLMNCYMFYSSLSALFLASFFISLSLYFRFVQLESSCGCFGKIGGSISNVMHYVMLLFMMLCSGLLLLNEVKNEKA